MRREYKLTTLKWINTRSRISHLDNRKSSISYGLEWQTRMLLDHLQLQLDKLNLASKIPHKHKGQPKHTQGFRSWIPHGSSNLAIERKLIKEVIRSQHRVMNDLDLRSSSLQEQFKEFTSWLSWGNIDKPRYTQILEKLKQIEEKKEKALADSAKEANIFILSTLRNAIEEQIEIVKKMSLELRLKQQEVESEMERLSKEIDPWEEKDFDYKYDTQHWEMLKQKEAAQRCILRLRQTFDEMKGMYDENVALLSNARELARNKDIASLRQLSHHQVEEFMSEWNHPYVKSFRVNYEFNILDSLLSRGLSLDGRLEFQDDNQETLRYIADGSNICKHG
ncbi:proton pump-interactor BIP103-like [Hibiscus syriacus]|uniref:proton pump-interactor BIP103-like n=1 Tax=Hibiscus syriacus TaxID=106335 RepID=UPI001923D2B0|nr:proton pump-interactor BIP103-like [Hibiscus syriacus]